MQKRTLTITQIISHISDEEMLRASMWLNILWMACGSCLGLAPWHGGASFAVLAQSLFSQEVSVRPIASHQPQLFSSQPASRPPQWAHQPASPNAVPSAWPATDELARFVADPARLKAVALSEAEGLVSEALTAMGMRYRWSEATVRRWCSILLCRYSEPQRQDHTLEHVSDLLLGLNTTKTVVDRDILSLAVLFHGRWVEPVHGRNETQNMALFEDFSREVCLSEGATRAVLYLNDRIQKHAADRFGPAFFPHGALEVLSREARAYAQYVEQNRAQTPRLPVPLLGPAWAGLTAKLLGWRTLCLSRAVQGVRDSQARAHLPSDIKRLETMGQVVQGRVRVALFRSAQAAKSEPMA